MYSSLDSNWEKELDTYNDNNCGRRLPKSEWFLVFWPAWTSSLTRRNIRSSWRQTGVFPCDIEAIAHELYGPSEVTDSKLVFVTVCGCVRDILEGFQLKFGARFV